MVLPYQAPLPISTLQVLCYFMPFLVSFLIIPFLSKSRYSDGITCSDVFPVRYSLSGTCMRPILYNDLPERHSFLQGGKMFFFLDIYIIQSGLLITLLLQCSLLIKETLPLVKVSETASKGSTVPTKDGQTFFLHR